VTVSGK